MSRAEDLNLEINGAVEWKGVSFSYLAHNGDGHNGKIPYALKNINVKVGAGESSRSSGAPDRENPPWSSCWRVCAADRGTNPARRPRREEMPLGALRRTVGMVPQEPTLFTDTLARNIAFGKTDASLDEIQSAAESPDLNPTSRCCRMDSIRSSASAGWRCRAAQKQRVTIARLLAYNPAIVVLDDALSSVRTETKKRCWTVSEKSVEGRTTIVVSHRASTVRDSDQIVVLEEGEIAERGTHEELMSRRGSTPSCSIANCSKRN